MEDADDDFGELYADVELQASSAINGVPDVTQLYIQQQQPQQPLSDEVSNGLLDSIKDDMMQRDLDMTNDEAVEIGSDSDDDEDDFDIVVNDDDVGAKIGGGNVRECRNAGDNEENEFVAVNVEKKNQEKFDGNGVEQQSGNGCISQYKFGRQYGSVSVVNQRPTNSSRCHKEDSDYIQSRRTTLRRVGPSYAGTSPCLSEYAGGGFWLPWNRTILDVDIDMLEHKPWSLPGADMTDYFNFGFDEKSWKSYCQSLDQLRQRTLTLGRNKVKGVRLTEDNETTAGEELGNRGVNESFFYNGGRMTGSQESEIPIRQFKKQIGQPIYVEDSNVERQPSMDARPPRARDSDVVIEISVVDPEGSSFGKEEPTKVFETKCTILEDGRVMENVKPETENTNNYKAHDAADDSVEENIKSPAASTEFKRPYDSGTESSHVLQDSGSQGNRHQSKSDALHSGKVDTLSRGYSGSVARINNSMENDRNSIETNPCVAGIDVLFGDQIQSSPTPSDSDTWSKASQDSDRYGPIKAQDSRRSSGDLISEGHHVEKYTHISRESDRDGVKMKGRDADHYSRLRSPIEEKRKHRDQMFRKHSEMNRCKDEDDSYRKRVRRHTHDESHFGIHQHRSDERLHASSLREESKRRREKESFLRCYDKRIMEHKVVHNREFREWDHWASRDEINLSSPRGWDEDTFFSESRFQRTRGKNVEAELYLRERECMIIDREPIFENHPHHTSMYAIHLERQNLERDYDDVRSSKRNRRDLSLEYGYSDCPSLDRYGRSPPMNYREAEYLDLDVEHERSSWNIGKEVEESGRGDQYLRNRPLGYDYLHCNRDGDEDENWLESPSNWDYLDRRHAYAERKHGSPVFRNDIDDFPYFEKHGRHAGYTSHRNARSNRRVYGHNKAHDEHDKVRYLDEDDYTMRQRNDFQSQGVNWIQDTQVHRHIDNDFYDEHEVGSFEGRPRHNWHETKNGFVRGGVSVHTKVMKYKLGIAGNGGSNSCDGSSERPERFEHQKMGTRGRNSVELRHFIGERKSSRQNPKPRRDSDNNTRATADERVQKLQEERHEVRKPSTKDTEQTGHRHVEVSQHNKPHFKNQDNTSDLEEGQIPTEEPCKENKSLKTKGMSGNQNKVSQNEATVYDESRILETMARMEKRRERFKDPILPVKKEPVVSDPKPQVEPVVETSEAKQQRPLRRRRWGGN